MNLGHLSLISFDPPSGIGMYSSEPNGPERKTGLIWCWVIVLFFISGLLYFLPDSDQVQKSNPTKSSSVTVEQKDGS